MKKEGLYCLIGPALGLSIATSLQANWVNSMKSVQLDFHPNDRFEVISRKTHINSLPASELPEPVQISLDNWFNFPVVIMVEEMIDESKKAWYFVMIDCEEGRFEVKLDMYGNVKSITPDIYDLQWKDTDDNNEKT
ncbi:MAG: hypothetical protein MRY83_24430 [Flavobacteriales bacterium]|nr:hypothetical protein [Flavobacteriales bacterium]